MRKILVNAEVITRSEKFGLCTDIWYSLDYRDTNGTVRNTIQYGKDVNEACQKKGIDWKTDQVKCCDCGQIYPEIFMNYLGLICDGCNELARMRREEYQEYKYNKGK